MGQHGLVEVDAAQALDPLGRAEQLEARIGPAKGGGVERATAQVVDGDDLAGRHPLGRRVVDRRRLGLGEQAGVAQAGGADRLVQQVDLVPAPVGGVGDGDRVGRAALCWATTARGGGGGAGRSGRRPTTAIRPGGSVWCPEPALELARHPARILQAPPGPRRRRTGTCRPRAGTAPTARRGVVGQGHHLGPAVPGDGGAGERRAEVEAQCVIGTCPRPGDCTEGRAGHSGARGDRRRRTGRPRGAGRHVPAPPAAPTWVSGSRSRPSGSPAPRWSWWSPASSRPARARS